MATGLTYNILPKIKFLEVGTLIKTKDEIIGNDAFGVNEDDEDFEFGADQVTVPAETVCFFAEDQQFYGTDKQTPLSAWIRLRLIAGEKVIHYTLLCERKRIWDFETFRGKKRKILNALNEQFEVLQQQEPK